MGNQAPGKDFNIQKDKNRNSNDIIYFSKEKIADGEIYYPFRRL